VFQNRALRRIFGPKRDEVTGGWRKQPNVELHSLYSSPNIIRMIKSRRMRCQACSTNEGEEKCIYSIGGKARRMETTRKSKTWVSG
jgi:hypothetical protein